MRLLVLYGSQTGNAQDLAESIWRSSKNYNFNGSVLPLDDYNITNLINEKLVVFVCSTTGQGDEPDNMKVFWKFLLRKSLPKDSLKNLRFAVLGLGDSSYEKYNYTAKKLFKRLIQLSGEAILPIGLCDDQHEHGIYATYFQWLDEFWQKLGIDKNNNIADTKYQFKIKVTKAENPENVQKDLDILKWPSAVNFHRFTVLKNERVTAINHFQDVRLIKLQFPSDVQWEPFDVINIRPCNTDEKVEKLFTILMEQNLDFTADTVVSFESVEDEMPLPLCFNKPLTLGLIAKYIWDLSAIPRQKVFEILALNCTDETEKEKLLEFCSPQGLDDLIKYANRPRRMVIEVLHDFPQAVSKITIPVLFELFSVIKSRSFSIASIKEIKTLDILVAIVEYKTILTESRKGLCSTWLKNIQYNDEILGNITKGTIKINPNKKSSLIMIGPGTGIAPFRSYLLKAKYDIENGLTKERQKIIVFFGCRSQFSDFFFKNEFFDMQIKNIARFFYAFSRDLKYKRYVQHVIKEQRDLLNHTILLQNATILVAGNSNNMPKQVREAFNEILGNPNYLTEIMMKKNRYQEDVWS